MKRVLWFVVLVAACKQGRGDRCQVAADCVSPLICNQATMTCVDIQSGGIDATVPVDGTQMDAPTDAPVDAKPADATVNG